MNKKGMTLLELLVYMALAALLLAPVIMLMNTSSKNMARDASNTGLRISGRDLLNIIYDDLKNTGFKLDPNGFNVKYAATYLKDTCTDNNNPVCIEPKDFSSFIPGDGIGIDSLYDTLTVIKGRLDPNSGEWVKADTIRYRVNAEKELLRDSLTINKVFQRVLARNVAALQFQYSDEEMVYWYDFDGYDSGNQGDLDYKTATKYIKVTLVLKDDKRLAATNNQTIMVIDRPNDSPPYKLVIDAPNDQALYERHEIVVPIPNNGLY
jgi:Tfp pilus assembly protein FimT